MKINNIEELIKHQIYLTDNELFNYSCQYGYLDGIKLLYKNGFDSTEKNYVSTANRINLLFTAIEKNYIEIFKFGIENNMLSSINIHNLFYEANIYNNTEIIKLLVENGADIHNSNESALKIAIRRNNSELIEYLISKGAETIYLDIDEMYKMNTLLRKCKLNKII